MTKSESKLKLTPVKINVKTKEVIAIQNITYIDLETARDNVHSMNANRKNKGKEVWLLAIHSRIKDYINGNETFLNTFTR